MVGERRTQAMVRLLWNLPVLLHPNAEIGPQMWEDTEILFSRQVPSTSEAAKLYSERCSGTLTLKLWTLPGGQGITAGQEGGSPRTSRSVFRIGDLQEIHGPDSRKSRQEDWVKGRQRPFVFRATPQPNSPAIPLHLWMKSDTLKVGPFSTSLLNCSSINPLLQPLSQINQAVSHVLLTLPSAVAFCKQLHQIHLTKLLFSSFFQMKAFLALPAFSISLSYTFLGSLHFPSSQYWLQLDWQ